MWVGAGLATGREFGYLGLLVGFVVSVVGRAFGAHGIEDGLRAAAITLLAVVAASVRLRTLLGAPPIDAIAFVAGALSAAYGYRSIFVRGERAAGRPTG